jgi:hypothetical protein
MSHDPTRDCEHGRLKGKCDVCDLQAEAEADKTIIEYHEATIKRLQYEVDAIPAIKEERDALAAELTRLKASIALDKMAENARDLGLDYEPAVQEPVFCEYCGGNDDADFGLPTDHCTDCARPQPDYAWPTIEDYEKEVGFKVNDAFKAAWTMARTTNDLFKQMGEIK